MGALDKRIFSGVAVVAALLLIVSSALLLADGGDISASSNDTALYISTVSGILTIVYSIMFLQDRSSFVRTLSGVFVAVTGIAFAAASFAGDNVGTILAIASLIAAVAIICDMLALWVTRVYGAMYVCAVLAALVLAMGVLHFINDARMSYYAISGIVFAVWLLLSAYISGFVTVSSPVKTREVKEDRTAKKAEKPMAKNTKATKKAKKPEPKPEPKPVEKVEEPKVESKKQDEPKPKVDEPKVVAKTPEKVAEKPKDEPKPVEKVEEPKVESAPKKNPVAGPNNDFMSKLMNSKKANSAAGMAGHDVKPLIHADEPKPVEKVEEPKDEPKVEEPVEEPKDEPKVEEPVEEPKDEPKVEEEPSAEPVKESKTEEPIEEPVEEPKDEPKVEEPVEEPVEESKIEEPKDEPKVEEEPSAEPVEESETEEPKAEEPKNVIPEPDWSSVTHDASQVVPEEPKSESESDSEQESEVDIYTDYSPEAMVRRATHNKGLRCRRGYGPNEIPVAFVNGKVAVYVTETGEKEDVDDVLATEGWTVLRYSFDQISDGKAQADEIAQAVKANIRTAKASKKTKKAKK